MKLAIYTYSGWSFGQLYKEVAKLLQADFLDWGIVFQKEELDKYDFILTICGPGSQFLVNHYGIPKEKIIIVAHAECDILQLLKQEPVENWNKYAGYGVVSDSLACSSLAVGITRVPTILRQGINRSFYNMPVPTNLRTVGYAALMQRPNEYGVEIKRGHLAQKATELAGLNFKIAKDLTREEMPGFYKSIDALIMSSLQEGGAIPPYEAASAGRLVIGTPVGDFPRLALEGMGILAPLNDEQFIKFTVETLKFYKERNNSFIETCENIQSASRQRDWPFVIQDWWTFVNQCHS